MRSGNEGLKTKTIRGSMINAAAGLVLKVLGFGQSILFARLFLPSEIGAIATATLVISLVGSLSQMGLDQSIVREESEPERRMNTAMTLSLMVSVAILLLLLVLAPLAGSVFGDTRLAGYIRFLSFAVFANLLVLPSAMWIREFRFGIAKLAGLIDVLGSISVTLVAFYVFKAGIWSLLWGRLAGFVGQYGFVWVFAPYRPRLELDATMARQLTGFGWPLTVSALANYFIYQGDDVLVRYFGGDAKLAFYTLAFTLPFYLKEVTDVVVAALLPSFSKIQNSIEGIAYAFSMSNKYLTVVLAPVGIGLAVFASQVIHLFYGERWAPTVPLLRLFALSFTIDVSLGYCWGIVALAKGKTRYLMYVRLLNVLFLATGGLYLIAKYGPMGGVWYTILQVCSFIVLVRCPFVLRELRTLSFLGEVWRPLLAAGTAGLLSAFTASLFGAGFPALIGLGVLFVAEYVGILYLIDRSSLAVARDVLAVLRSDMAGILERRS